MKTTNAQQTAAEHAEELHTGPESRRVDFVCAIVRATGLARGKQTRAACERLVAQFHLEHGEFPRRGPECDAIGAQARAETSAWSADKLAGRDPAAWTVLASGAIAHRSCAERFNETIAVGIDRGGRCTDASCAFHSAANS